MKAGAAKGGISQTISTRSTTEACITNPIGGENMSDDNWGDDPDNSGANEAPDSDDYGAESRP